MEENIAAVRFTCDACNKTTIIEAGHEHPKGYYGDVYLISDGGGMGGVKWYACSQSCIQDAVTTALFRDC